MAEARIALFDLLRADDTPTRKALQAAVGDVDLATVRARLRDEPGSGEAGAGTWLWAPAPPYRSHPCGRRMNRACPR